MKLQALCMTVLLIGIKSIHPKTRNFSILSDDYATTPPPPATPLSL